MDSFGSNATPMGGAAGRTDAMIGAVEAQKAEGVLHVHLFLYIQMRMQQSNLYDLPEKIREKLMSTNAIKRFVSYVRCAEYPDLTKFKNERSQIEKDWPAYKNDPSLCRLPEFFWKNTEAPGDEWINKFNDRLQHALMRKNHHIHPLVDPQVFPPTLQRSCRELKVVSCIYESVFGLFPNRR